MPFPSRTTASLADLRLDGPVAIGVVDVDQFDLVNDRDGFAAGDRVLAAVEDALLAGLPGGAALEHVKGDEWRVALVDASPEELLVVLDGIRRQLASDGPTTIAAGVAARPQHGTTLEDLLAAADGALTRAKDAGGNRIAIAVEEKMVLKSSYYTRAALRRLAKLSERTQRTDASHLREALDAHLAAHAELL
jgi:diguanylate cyclase (GGDEF)-like protein